MFATIERGGHNGAYVQSEHAANNSLQRRWGTRPCLPQTRLAPLNSSASGYPEDYSHRPVPPDRLPASPTLNKDYPVAEETLRQAMAATR